MSSDELDKIFDKFYQIDSTSTRKVGGSGLGLSIVKGIIEGQGGTISATSEPGNGSTFVFTLKKSM
jgi:signal transduction histidine kinase